MKTYRSLTELEIDQLAKQGCEAEDWSRVEVDEAFLPDYVRECVFSGTVQLGHMNGILEMDGGISRHAGLYQATLRNVTVGDGCFIGHVSGCIFNYSIGDGTYINQVNMLFANEGNLCANGLKVMALNESGGTPVKMYSALSAQEAYLMVNNAYNKTLIRQWDMLIDAYIRQRKPSHGYIGNNVRIMGVVRMEDVYVGDGAIVEGASRLTDCSLISSEETPVTIGCNVICEDVIVCGGSSIREGVVMKECFVGQACRIGSGYSITSSLVFCNSELENGEACALFAGPFTVSHHKSTLLIAGMFSFYNAGSATNQSNHMYKLGPVHSGVLQRGSKTASGCHILWPSKVGAFTMVMGKQSAHLDTRDFPFSYLMDEKGTSILLPGVNLCTVGTYRDSRKWENRDKREENGRLDWVHFSMLSPFTIQFVLRGREHLWEIQKQNVSETGSYQWRGVAIPVSAVAKALDLYEIAINVFIGQTIVKRLSVGYIDDREVLSSLMCPTLESGAGEWADLSGMLVPETEIGMLLDDIEQGNVISVEEIKNRLQEMFDLYSTYEWAYLVRLFLDEYSYHVEELTPSVLMKFLNSYEISLNDWYDRMCKDAQKELDWGGITEDELQNFISKARREREAAKAECDKILQRLQTLG